MLLGGRIALASAVLAALVAAAFIVLALTIGDLRRSTEKATRAQEVTSAALVTQQLVIDLETGLRGFVLSGNDRLLEPWREAQEALPSATARLERLTGADPDQAARARSLGALI